MLPDRLRSLGYLLARLPGVGEKTAQRFALFLAGGGLELARDLGTALLELPSYLGVCRACGNIAERTPDLAEGEEPLCPICRDQRRDRTLLCIATRVQDLLALERSGAMTGTYFLLGRLLSPLDGVGPDELPVAKLLHRIETDGVKEVIIATPPSVDGEATALFIAKELESTGVSITRIASGVPHGGDLEFADQITLGRAIRGRRGMGSP